MNHKFEFIVEQFQILNKTVQNESEKNEEFRNKQEKWNKNQEQKIDDGFAKINHRLDKIENCSTIKKELAEQEKANLTKNENQDKEAFKIENSPSDDNDKKED